MIFNQKKSTTFSKKTFKKFILAPAILCLFSLDAIAADTFWNNPVSGNWNDTNNWTNGLPVSGTDSAYINNNGQATITDAQVANVLFVGLNSGQNGTLNVTGPNGTLTLNRLNIGFETLGTVTVDGVGSTLTSANTISVGINPGGIGTLTASNNALISAPGAVVIGQAGSTGNLSLNSNATLSTPLVFFSNGGGSVNFNGGILKATANQANFIFGIGPSSLNINADGATIDSNGFNIGTALGFTGNGGLTKKGLGTFTLTGTNTYSGGTTISAGTLQLGNGGAAGSVVGNILNNGTLVFNRNVSSVYADVISGTGSVRQSGAQPLVFTGDNTYSGITTIDTGTFLQLGDNTSAGSISGDVALGGGLIFKRSDVSTYLGDISGAGSVDNQGGLNSELTLSGDLLGGLSLKQSGTGKTILTGTNNYSGGTTIFAGGTLQIGNGGAIGSLTGNIVNNAALIFNRSGTVIYGDVISGLGTLRKLGSGTLTLNGTNTFTGDTTITEGILLLGDANHSTAAVGGDVNVEMGAQLSGFGTVGGNLDNDGGIVSPGNSIGTITVNGNYTQSGTGSYIVQVDQAGNSDLLNILGTANLNGIVGISAINNGFLRNYAYTILTTAPGGRTGTFSNTNIDGVFDQGLLEGKVLYSSDMVQFLVDYNPALFNEFASTPNQKAVADYILETGGTPAVQALMASITTEPGFQSAMDQISGATYANNDVMITRVGNWFSGEMADRFDAFPSCNCRVSLLPANRRGCDQKNAFWAAGHGAEENISSGQVSGLNTDTGNFALGYEWAMGSAGKVGVGAGYSTFSSRAQSREMANTTGNLYQVGLYGRRQMGNWLLGAAFDAGVTSDMDTDRRIEGALAVVTTKGSSKAHLYSEQVRLGYDVTSNRPIRVSPFVGVIGQQLNRNSFAETTQTGFELNVNGSTYRSTRSQLGVMLELPTNSVFKPFASLDWEHEFSDVNSTFNANLVGLEGKFHIQGQAIGRNSALLKAGTVIACGKNWNVSALYQGWYGSGWQENGGTLQASMAFG